LHGEKGGEVFISTFKGNGPKESEGPEKGGGKRKRKKKDTELWETLEREEGSTDIYSQGNGPDRLMKKKTKKKA